MMILGMDVHPVADYKVHVRLFISWLCSYIDQFETVWILDAGFAHGG